MRHLFLKLIITYFFIVSCSDNNECNEYMNSKTITKRTDIQYSQYGNFKKITYYENKKPIVDSTFYFDTDYPAEFQSKTNWLYNENGLVKKIIIENPHNSDVRFKEIAYNDMQQISSINSNEYTSTFVYNGLQVTKTHHHIPGNTDYIYQYEMDNNGHIISEINPNSFLNATAQYENDNVSFLSTSQVPSYRFDYLESPSVPLFMKYPEFGENQLNYVLFSGGLHINTILNRGNKFVNQVSNDDGISWANLTFSYEFNQQSLPVYIKKYNGDYIYYESYFEYEQF